MSLDLRCALRRLRRAPLFTLIAILSLGIGIGATMTVFTIANALLFRPPAGVRQPDRVVDIGRTDSGAGFDTSSYPNFVDVRARNTVFTDVYAAVLGVEPMGLATGSRAQRVYGSVVTNNYFEVLGTRSAAGRLLSSADSAVPGAAPFVVLSHAFWIREFRGDRSIVGHKLVINGYPFAVVGVAEAGFQGTSVFRPDLWLPMSMLAEAEPRNAGLELTSRRSNWLMMGARLKRGVTVVRAQAELSMIARQLAQEYPQVDQTIGLRVVGTSRLPGHEAPLAGFLAGLLAVGGLVLVIACSNLAGVLLARGTSRRREIAVRRSLGASRASIVTQSLTEAGLLAIGGAVIGIAIAFVSTRLIAMHLGDLPVQVGMSPRLDARVALFAVALCVVVTILSGLLPALESSKADIAASLKPEAGSAPRRARLRTAFVVAQVALGVVLAVAAGLSVRALDRAADIDPGFDPQGVDVLGVDLSLAGYTDRTGPRFAADLVGRVRAIPGVESASFTAILPLQGIGMGRGALYLPGRTAPADAIDSDCDIVDRDYFATMRTAIVRGRPFDGRDRAGGARVTIVNETMARRLWPGEDPVGKALLLEETADEREALTVVGVARDGRYRSLGEARRMFFWLPLQQEYVPRLNLIVRSKDGGHIAAEMRDVVHRMAPTLPIVSSQSLTRAVSLGLVPQRIVASVSGSLGTIGLLLATMGIYGMIAFFVTSRRREIAVRMALGAERRAVALMVIRQGMKLVWIGVVVGCLLGLAAGRLLRSLLLGVSPVDLVAFIAPAVIFCVAGLAATWFAARRATCLEPSAVLRSE